MADGIERITMAVTILAGATTAVGGIAAIITNRANYLSPGSIIGYGLISGCAVAVYHGVKLYNEMKADEIYQTQKQMQSIPQIRK